ncbi:MAG: TolC family protein [Bacteroidales bacterium]|nr:TolC family protein [Candidatus Cacconaster equi]
MKNLKYIILAATAISLTSCGIFGKYQPETTVPDNLFGTGENVEQLSSQPSIGELSWRDFFTDENLRELIDTALVRNTDLEVARLQVEEANAALTAAKLGYLPSLSFTPSLNLTPGNSYVLPLNLNWETNGFGSITTRKREAAALAFQAADYEQLVRSQLIASVAEIYGHLIILDKQLEIVNAASHLFREALDTEKALMENGKAYSTAVNQLESSAISVDIQKVEIEAGIREVEAALCLLLKQTPQHIKRGTCENLVFSEKFGTGVPAQVLENRADVRAAQRALEAAFYVTAQSRAAMVPALSLSGLLGWTNNGVAITDPLSLVYNAAISLVQPVFANGKLSANLKISKMRQQEAAERFAQTVVAAGNDVNVALTEYQMCGDKAKLYEKQVDVLHKAFDGTRELMKNGKATYLEVLISQESYLNAQMSECTNKYNRLKSAIQLYAALGGGTK